VTTHVLTNSIAAHAAGGRRERVRSKHATLVEDEGNHELYFLCKRAIDVALSALLLVLVAPLLCVIAVAIRLETAGPVLFVQERVGARRRTNGRTRWEVRHFPCFKFRSMVAGADESVHREYIHAFVHGRLGPASGAGARFKLTQDNRITRVGRLLRKTSLDELPQLLNVLRGDMSLVGPRPVPLYEAAEYTEWEVERLAALPGITGLWQVKGRAEVPFGEMVRMDREYVRRQSLWLDLQILFATIPVVLWGRGAR
jgi:lipopolysaccharide/colanic/teichoic acid biosynthesis glycosyltransferase